MGVCEKETLGDSEAKVWCGVVKLLFKIEGDCGSELVGVKLAWATSVKNCDERIVF